MLILRGVNNKIYHKIISWEDIEKINIMKKCIIKTGILLWGILAMMLFPFCANAESLSEPEITEQAVGFLEKMYGKNSGLRKTDFRIEDTVGTEEKFYVVTYVDDNDICYEVSLLAENGELRHIILNEPEVDYEQEALIVDSDMLEQLYKEAEEIFFRVWADGHEFVSSTCEYNMTKDNKIPHGDIVFLFELKNGDAIKILYNVNRESFWNMTYLYFYDSYRNQQEESEKYREESGITRKVINMYP